MSLNVIIRKSVEEITLLGGVLFFLLFSSLFLFNRQYNLFFQLLLGLILIYFIAFIIRIFYFKPRPQHQKYRNFLEKIDASSFPSIHSARATFLFIFLVYNFFNSLLLLSLAFIAMILVFFSRIYLKKHYTEDIIGGILLGIFSFFISYLIIN